MEQSAQTTAALIESRTGSILELTLNRPAKLNSMDSELRTMLQTALDNCRHDASVRAVIITGAGRAFCAGEDLSEVTDPPATRERFGQIVGEYNEIVRALRSMPQAVICALNGIAAGAGANLALACDFILAAEGSSFVQSFVKIGLVPDTGGSYFLPRLVGAAKARELALLGERITAEEAKALSLVRAVVPPSRLLDEARNLAARVAALPPRAIAATKQLLDGSFENSLATQLEHESVAQMDAASSDDYAEGIAAFFEKREPKFTGR